MDIDSVEPFLIFQHQMCREVRQHRMPSMALNIQSEEYGLQCGDVPFLFPFFFGSPYVVALQPRMPRNDSVKKNDSVQPGEFFSPRARATFLGYAALLVYTRPS